MHHYYERVSALTVISLKAEQCMIILVHSDSLLAAPNSAIVLSSRVFPVPRIQPRENVFFIFSLRCGSCHLKDTGKRHIVCPEAQLLEPLKTCGFVCQHKLPLISSRGNFHFNSALTLEWHIYTYMYIIHIYTYVRLCVLKSHTYIQVHSWLFSLWVSGRLLLLLEAQMDILQLTFLSQGVRKDDRAHLHEWTYKNCKQKKQKKKKGSSWMTRISSG